MQLDVAKTVEVLAEGELCVVDRLPRASNVTLLATVRHTEIDGGIEIPVVYKPRRGERPLWDFPRGTLCSREVAAFVLSEELGWGLVPPTVLRTGELGIGSVQLFVPPDDSVDVVDLVESGHRSLVPTAVFDVLANNADRKVSHCLPDTAGRIWAIDNGLTFSDEPGKLRTVLWAWIGEAVPEELLADVARLADRLAERDSGVRTELADFLTTSEIDALEERTAALLADPRFPEPDPWGHAVPWPPY
jgi:hypothetical protein